VQHRWRIAILASPIVGVAVLVSGNVAAEERDSRRPFLLELRSGFNTSTDMLGVVGSVHPVNVLGAGLGVGVDPSGNPQFAALARFRPISGILRSRKHALLVELAFSQGSYERLLPMASCEGSEGACPRFKVSDSARWGHVDLAWETENKSGISVRLGAGVAVLLNPSSMYCESERCATVPLPLATLTIGVGYAF
jgi:hypothetical protein